ncbi:MAG: hypothetical protein AAGA56_08180 [Myxococcota bacterium]
MAIGPFLHQVLNGSLIMAGAAVVVTLAFEFSTPPERLVQRLQPIVTTLPLSISDAVDS